MDKGIFLLLRSPGFSGRPFLFVFGAGICYYYSKNIKIKEKENPMISVLPPQEHTFTIDLEGSSSKERFHGSFTYARPTIGVSIEIAKTEAFLKGGTALDEDSEAITRILATLRHTLTKYPEWWKQSGFGVKLYDLNVLFELISICNKFEDDRNEKLNKVEVKDEQVRS